MHLRFALTNVEKAWLASLPPGTVVLSYIDPVTGQWGVGTAEDLVGGSAPPTGANPDAPTNALAVVDSATQITLTWDHGGPDTAQGFFIYRNDNLVKTIFDRTARSYIDSVAPLGTYTYKVSAYNTALRFESAQDTAATVSTPADTTVVPPGIPSSVLASEISPGRVMISWQYNSSVPISNFQINRLGSFLADVPFGTNQFIDTTGVAGQQYTWSVAGENTGYGVGTFSSESSPVTITAPSSPPTAPTILAVAQVDSTSLLVTWDYSSGNHKGFVVDVSGPNGYLQSYSGPAGITQSSRSFLIPNLLPSSTYSVVVSTWTLSGAIYATYPSSPMTGTTAAGTAPTGLRVDPTYPRSLYGVVGVNFSTTSSPIQVLGGVPGRTIVFALETVSPTWLGLGSDGVWAANTPTAPASSQLVTVSISDGVTTLHENFYLTVDAAAMYVAQPANVVDGSILGMTKSSAFNKTWTASFAQGPFSFIWSGIPDSLGLTPTYTSTSTTLNVTSTQTIPNDYPISLTVTSFDGQVQIFNYTLSYNVGSGGANNPPVFPVIPSPVSFFSGTAYSVMTTALATDPDAGATVTEALVSVVARHPTLGDTTLAFTGPVSNVYTITGLGTTFNAVTGVVGGTYTSTYDGYQIIYTVSADDGVANIVPFTVVSTIPPLYTSGVSAVPLGVGIKVTGGDGTGITYAAVSGGSAPGFLGTYDMGTGLFPGVAGTVSGGAASYTFTLGATQSGVTKSVIVTLSVVVAGTNGFLSRVPGTLKAFDMQYVYLNGNTSPARTVTQLGTITVDGSNNESGFGSYASVGDFVREAAGGTLLRAFTWKTDPTGYQSKVASLTIDKDTGPNGGAFSQRLDGVITSVTSSGGTVYPKIFVEWRVFLPRALIAYRDPTTNGQMKQGHLGVRFGPGELIITSLGFTGFPSVLAWGEEPFLTDKSIVNPIGFYSYYRHDINWPNPWGKVQPTQAGYIIQNAGPWKPNAPASMSMPTGTTKADKIDYYRYYGLLRGSSQGLEQDLGSLGVNGLTAGGVNTPWLDLREHKISGVDVGWPASCVRENTPYLHMDEWNNFQLYFERNDDMTGRITAWHSWGENPPQLIMDERTQWTANSPLTLDSHRVFEFMQQATDRLVDTNRPPAEILWGETIFSLNPIKMPGGHTPVFNFPYPTVWPAP